MRSNPQFILLLLTVTLAFTLLPSPQHAQAQSSFSGFVSNYNAFTTQPPNEIISGRNRVRLNFRNDFRDGRVYISSDLRQLYSFSSDSLDFRLREAFLDIYLDNADLRIGKQTIAWGKTEGDFIFDIVSPFDLSEFLTQDFRELREGVTAFNYTHFFGRNQFQFIVNPVFEPSRLPDYDGVWGIVPTDIFPIPTEFESFDPGRVTLSDMQYAARFAWRPSASFDIDLALMYWRSSTPGYRKTFETIGISGFRVPLSVTFTEDYEPGIVGGFWGEYRVSSDLRFVFEAAWFQKRPYDILPGDLTDDDLRLFRRLDQGTINLPDIGQLGPALTRFNNTLNAGQANGFLTYRPALKWMTGIQYPVLNWNTSVQYVADVALDYEDAILQEEWFHGVSLSTNRSFFRDQLLARLLTRYQFNGNDYWINPELAWDFRDGLTFTGGAHLFGGESPDLDYTQLSFRRFGGNSLIYLSAAWFW
ncbi:MAG: hypothetical protein LAT84_05850 [Balneolia bacterium]|nr:hypothetical protein [Balneolia bacterium]